MQPIIQAFVHQLDPVLRRVHRVWEFTEDPQCVLRVALSFSNQDLQLSDGTQIRRGDRIVELHLWNERIPRMPPEGPDLAWSLQFYRRLLASLRLVARWMEHHPEAGQARALRGETSMVDPARGLIQALGFDLILLEQGARGWRRLRYQMDDFYVWLLMRTYNPASLRNRRLHQLERVQFWISREAFLRRYGTS
ncbi:YkoP family protein [Thermoflexus sp.]|uniref:YkoP family protein n=1 Tax=Thermoflexus sp. TaxID=1969742 RepID=UPI002ADD518E|nr:hypothetical protein [Thermoflexus sp.]